MRPENALKRQGDVQDGAHVVVLGGPAMLIGLGGGAASSSASAEATADLDFDSVQRGNPEMERRAQMVINTCVALGDQNPIAMIHDVGAGGLSNALPGTKLYPRSLRASVVTNNCRTRERRRLWWQIRATTSRQRRQQHEPDGDLGQRSSGAIRHTSQQRQLESIREHLP